MLNIKEIAQKKVQIAELREQVEALQTPDLEPKADDYSDEMEFIESRRRWRNLEDRRLDDVVTKNDFLLSQESRLQREIAELEPVKSAIDEGFVEYRAAALAANRILDEAEKAIAKVVELSNQQARLGHQLVYDLMPLDMMQPIELPIFTICNDENRLKIAVWGRDQFRQLQRDGRVGEGTET